MHPNPAFRPGNATEAFALAREWGFGMLAVSVADAAPMLSHIPFLVAEDGSGVVEVAGRTPAVVAHGEGFARRVALVGGGLAASGAGGFAVAAMPDLAGLPGPHGITLRRHAEAGGAARVLDLLESFPASNRGPSSLPVTETEGDTMLGTYRFGPRSDGVLVIERNRQGDLAIRRGTFSSRVLHRVEADSLTFAPAGSPAVRICLQGDTLTVIDGRFSLAASRQTGG